MNSVREFLDSEPRENSARAAKIKNQKSKILYLERKTVDDYGRPREPWPRWAIMQLEPPVTIRLRDQLYRVDRGHQRLVQVHARPPSFSQRLHSSQSDRRFYFNRSGGTHPSPAVFLCPSDGVQDSRILGIFPTRIGRNCRPDRYPNRPIPPIVVDRRAANPKEEPRTSRLRSVRAAGNR